MKKSTLWKIGAFILLIAICLPLVPKFSVGTEVKAVSTVAPLPYAMEQYGQNQSGIYNVDSAPTKDGEFDETLYTLMGAYDDQVGNFAGIFVSTKEDGSDPIEPATEFVPDLMEIYGAYDDENAYFYVKTRTRTTDGGYGLKLNFGFNFSSSQKDAQDSHFTLNMEIPSGKTENSDEYYVAKTATETEITLDSTGEYYQNATVYECAVPWTVLAPEGKEPKKDFDRFYLSGALRYFDGGATMYWVYGVPNSVTLPSNATVGSAFGKNAASYTPNIVNLLGQAAAITVAPEIAAVDRVDKNKTQERTFEVTLSIKGVDSKNVRSAGVIFTENAASLGSFSPVWTSDGKNVISTTERTGESTLNFTVTFATSSDYYEVFFSLRPFVQYTDDSVVYGSSYSNTPSYFDALAVEYKEYIKLLMIGSSFCTYYLDEMVQIAKADDVHLTVVRAYKSGGSAYEHWTFMVNDFKSEQYEVLTRRMCSPESPNPDNKGYFNLKEILEYADWDYITCQDGYRGNEYAGVYREGHTASHPNYEDSVVAAMHMQKLFRWLEHYYPKAELYIHHSWARQVGYGYVNDSVTIAEDGSVLSGTIKSGFEDPMERIDNLEAQAYLHENIVKTCETVSEMTGVPRVPTGIAWAIARQNPIIGDTLCNRSSGTDYYHDGDVGGGQYLNAAVYYEVMTGNDVRGNTWRPSYDISDEKILALQEAAHEAVLDMYGPDHYTK